MLPDLKIGEYFKKIYPPKFWRAKLRRVKGSLKDPFLYLGIFSVILFGLILLGTGFILKTLDNQGESIFLATVSKIFPDPEGTPSNQNLFIGATKKAWPESPDFLLVEKTSLRAVSPLVTITPQVLGMWLGEEEPETRREITEYIVKEGDSLWQISKNFNISLETIFWANNLKSLLIRPGQKLLILPVSGVIHLVKEGDTVSELAKKYKTEAEKIITFNELSGEGDLVINEVLIIPDGKLPSVSIVQPVDSTALSRLSTNNFYGLSHAYPYGQCTWWVAQKRAIPSWGHAKNWLDNAIRSGYAVCKGNWCIPRVGAVISLKGNWLYGHVGYIEEVRGDKVVFSEMNYIGWGRMNYRTLRVGSLPIKGYIY